MILFYTFTKARAKTFVAATTNRLYNCYQPKLSLIFYLCFAETYSHYEYWKHSY